MNGPGSRAAIYGPEPWRTNRNVVFSHWDLWFCVVAVADHDGDLDQLAAAIEGDRRSFASSTAERKLSHLDDLRRRLADIGIDAAALAGSAADDQRVRNKARTKVLKQGLYSRDLTDAMRQTPRERLYDRALRGRWQRFPVSPEPFYDRLANGLGEGHLPKGATFRLARRIEAARDRLQRQTAKDPAARLAAQAGSGCVVLRGDATLRRLLRRDRRARTGGATHVRQAADRVVGDRRRGLVRRPLRAAGVGGLGAPLPARDGAVRANPWRARRTGRSVSCSRSPTSYAASVCATRQTRRSRTWPTSTLPPDG